MAMVEQRASAKRVSVIGAGYVGLTTAVVLAHLGHQVCCGEVDAEKVDLLNAGTPTIFEDELEAMLKEGLESGSLHFVVGAAAAVDGADFVFLCVPTPQREDGSADVTALESAALEIAPHLALKAVVVNKSTVPVGSTTLIERLLGRPDVSVVSNPEFLREGSAIHDCLHPDRIVVGSDDKYAAAAVGTLFSAVGAPLIITDAATSETIKYASNAFLATKLSFVNAVATFCEHLHADIRDVLLGIGYDRRIGFEYLQPGPGWGGSCLPKDTRALLYMAQQGGYEFPLLREVIDTNEEQVASIVTKMRTAVGGGLAAAEVATWGLSFKSGTDDRRHSPAIDVINRLVAEGAHIRAFDPTVTGPVSELPENVEICADAYTACKGAAAVAVLTEWEDFKALDLRKVSAEMAQPRMVDARNLFDPSVVRRAGFLYIGLGLP
jgi:UDPglucose 6-dehydrogenase